MKKIVIIKKGTENDHRLIQLLRGLFPECEIRTLSPITESSEECKYFDRRNSSHLQELFAWKPMDEGRNCMDVRDSKSTIIIKKM